MSHVVKTAISLPRQDFQRIEQWRRKSKKSRSQVVLEALRAWFTAHALKNQEEKYAQGYLIHPEEKAELGGSFKAGLTSWHKEEW